MDDSVSQWEKYVHVFVALNLSQIMTWD